MQIKCYSFAFSLSWWCCLWFVHLIHGNSTPFTCRYIRPQSMSEPSSSWCHFCYSGCQKCWSFLVECPLLSLLLTMANTHTHFYRHPFHMIGSIHNSKARFSRSIFHVFKGNMSQLSKQLKQVTEIIHPWLGTEDQRGSYHPSPLLLRTRGCLTADVSKTTHY